MKTDFAIRVAGVSKRYRIRERRPYQTLKDFVARPFAGRKAGPEGGDERADRDPDVLWALRDVSFDVDRGEVVGIIGRNGSGKSTLLKILSRITPPTLGQVEIRGRLGSLLEVGTGFHPELTGRENIQLNAAILGMSRREVAARSGQILDFAEVRGFEDTPVKHYSSGMQVRLAFAVAAHLEPEILLVDEVLAVGDLAFQKKCLGKLDEVTRGGRTVLFVSHDLSAVAQLCARCLVLDGGRPVFLGNTGDAIQRYAAAQANVRQVGRRPLRELVHEKHIQLDPRVRIVELGLAAGQEDEIPVGGALRLDLLLETDIRHDALALGYSVNDAAGGAILSGWSPPFPVEAGSHAVSLSIAGLPLAPGAYDLSLAALTGAIDRPSYTYDIVLRFGRFHVRAFAENGTPVVDWQRGWGRIVHRTSEVHVTSP